MAPSSARRDGIARSVRQGGHRYRLRRRAVGNAPFSSLVIGRACRSWSALSKDEIEAMLAAHMAVTNIALLELFARMRGAIAGHRYEGNGIKRLEVLGNLTTKFMRTYTMQVEALPGKDAMGRRRESCIHRR
jgi:hypothetical protein